MAIVAIAASGVAITAGIVDNSNRIGPCGLLLFDTVFSRFNHSSIASFVIDSPHIAFQIRSYWLKLAIIVVNQFWLIAFVVAVFRSESVASSVTIFDEALGTLILIVLVSIVLFVTINKF